ncbi:MAG: hypothetical protein D6732_05610 [Methanobacteriota archaeon]|nr:MAG: hypothetical protein D6732_05610 [Euryarchaeota archaeon]
MNYRNSGKMLRRRRYYVIYPEYFDKNRSRNRGRRVPLSLAVEDPELPRIAKACQLLGFEYEKQLDKAYPSNWWNRKGRILIKIDKKNKVPKEKILKEIAQKAKKLVPKKKLQPQQKRDKDGKLQPKKTASAKARRKKKRT